MSCAIFDASKSVIDKLFAANAITGNFICNALAFTAPAWCVALTISSHSLRVRLQNSQTLLLDV